MVKVVNFTCLQSLCNTMVGSSCFLNATDSCVLHSACTIPSKKRQTESYRFINVSEIPLPNLGCAFYSLTLRYCSVSDISLVIIDPKQYGVPAKCVMHVIIVRFPTAPKHTPNYLVPPCLSSVGSSETRCERLSAYMKDEISQG